MSKVLRKGVIAASVLEQFTGAGKKHLGVKKPPFIETKFFKALQSENLRTEKQAQETLGRSAEVNRRKYCFLFLITFVCKMENEWIKVSYIMSN